jgi:hypothetical protein
MFKILPGVKHVHNLHHHCSLTFTSVHLALQTRHNILGLKQMNPANTYISVDFYAHK